MESSVDYQRRPIEKASSLRLYKYGVEREPFFRKIRKAEKIRSIFIILAKDGTYKFKEFLI
jgi:hypothetical protein